MVREKTRPSKTPKTIITLTRYGTDGKRQKPVRLSWESAVEIVFRPVAI